MTSLSSTLPHHDNHVLTVSYLLYSCWCPRELELPGHGRHCLGLERYSISTEGTDVIALA